MYLAQLSITNFRKIRNATLHFQAGLNVIVGANNVGKTAVIDALRALLAGHDEPYPRLDADDLHRSIDGEVDGSITFHYIFKDLSPDDEADFLNALRPGDDRALEAHIFVRYTNADVGGRLRVTRWCGEHEDVALTADMMENLRGVYLQPLRDASQSLRPSRSSQLARLLQMLADEQGREGINAELRRLDDALRQHPPLLSTQAAITTRHSNMLGEHLAQTLEVGLSASDFQRLSSRLSLTVDKFEIERNGLGFNNLIFMAVVLSELAKNPEASYRSLIVEEPEAHLHPQLQSVLLRYLENIHAAEGDKPVQIFVTSHSPNFASIADLDSLTCLVDTGRSVEAFFPRNVDFAAGKREKLKRYMDVTKAELFFARRVIFVEGASELMMMNILAARAGFDLRGSAVSLISVEGLNFDSFLPLFGENALKVPVALITDADPAQERDDDAPALALYPAPGDQVVVSANTALMKHREDAFVKVFHGLKTFEYDFALHEQNRVAMLAALRELHPIIGRVVEAQVNEAAGDAAKAKALFSGMFERDQNNVKKGRFAQALAQVLADPAVNCIVPDYIHRAITHACQPVAPVVPVA